MEKLIKSANGQWHIKGVHTSNNPQNPGRSTMGIMNSLGAGKEAKGEAKRVMDEQKRMPKPSISKGEDQHEENEKPEKKVDKKSKFADDTHYLEGDDKAGEIMHYSGKPAIPVQKNVNNSYAGATNMAMSEEAEKNDKLRELTSRKWSHLRSMKYPAAMKGKVKVHRDTREIHENGKGVQWRMPEEKDLAIKKNQGAIQQDDFSSNGTMNEVSASEVCKTDKNGQWSLEKAAKDRAKIGSSMKVKAASKL